MHLRDHARKGRMRRKGLWNMEYGGCAMPSRRRCKRDAWNRTYARPSILEAEACEGIPHVDPGSNGQPSLRATRSVPSPRDMCCRGIQPNEILDAEWNRFVFLAENREGTDPISMRRSDDPFSPLDPPRLDLSDRIDQPYPRGWTPHRPKRKVRRPRRWDEEISAKINAETRTPYLDRRLDDAWTSQPHQEASMELPWRDPENERVHRRRSGRCPRDTAWRSDLCRACPLRLDGRDHPIKVRHVWSRSDRTEKDGFASVQSNRMAKEDAKAYPRTCLPFPTPPSCSYPAETKSKARDLPDLVHVT